MNKKLINVAGVKAALESGQTFQSRAIPSKEIPGYFLHLDDGESTLVLSTWLSDTPRLFKKADALLKEAKAIGLSIVEFQL